MIDTNLLTESLRNARAFDSELLPGKYLVTHGCLGSSPLIEIPHVVRYLAAGVQNRLVSNHT
jgi:hypothetical protein